MNIRCLLRKAGGPQPLCRVVSRANFGYWHPSATDIILSGVTDSHPVLGLAVFALASVPQKRQVYCFVIVPSFPQGAKCKMKSGSSSAAVIQPTTVTHLHIKKTDGIGRT